MPAAEKRTNQFHSPGSAQCRCVTHSRICRGIRKPTPTGRLCPISGRRTGRKAGRVFPHVPATPRNFALQAAFPDLIFHGSATRAPDGGAESGRDIGISRSTSGCFSPRRRRTRPPGHSRTATCVSTRCAAILPSDENQGDYAIADCLKANTRRLSSACRRVTIGKPLKFVPTARGDVFLII